MSKINITYRFRFPDNEVREYLLEQNEDTLEIEKKDADDCLEPWLLLESNQCPNCPLDKESHPYCPAAKNIGWLIKESKELQSYDSVSVEVITEERTIVSSTTMQRGMSSLLGLMIAGSSCPYTHFLKPMARFHLPFASEEETIYRASSTYLLMQYFLQSKEQPNTVNLENLAKLYKNLHLVNTGMAERVRLASESDVTVNAIILLDLFAKAMPYSIEDSLSEIKQLFSPALQTSMQG